MNPYYDKNRVQILENSNKRRRNEKLGITDNSITDEATLSEMFKVFKSKQKLDRAEKRRIYRRKYMSVYRNKSDSAILSQGEIRAKLIRAKRNFDRKQKNQEKIKYDTVYINDGYEVLEYDLKNLTFEDEHINNSYDLLPFDPNSYGHLQFLEQQLDKHDPISIEEPQHELKKTSEEEDTRSSNIVIRSNIVTSDEEEEEDEDDDFDFDDNDSKGSFAFLRNPKVLFCFFGILV
jgi:hypothetical protein